MPGGPFPYGGAAVYSIKKTSSAQFLEFYKVIVG